MLLSRDRATIDIVVHVHSAGWFVAVHDGKRSRSLAARVAGLDQPENRRSQPRPYFLHLARCVNRGAGLGRLDGLEVPAARTKFADRSDGARRARNVQRPHARRRLTHYALLLFYTALSCPRRQVRGASANAPRKSGLGPFRRPAATSRFPRNNTKKPSLAFTLLLLQLRERWSCWTRRLCRNRSRRARRGAC
jgi:hypothetical protein